MLPLLEQLRRHTGIATSFAGIPTTYPGLLREARRFSAALLQDRQDLEEKRIAFLVPPGTDYVAALLGIWQAGGVAVPLSPLHPPAEWAYFLDDADVSAVLVHPDYEAKLRPAAEQLGRPVVSASGDEPAGLALPDLAPSRRALILYTSGTTGKAKGVVSTHANLQAQIEMLVAAWEWSPRDHILHALPLHHVHGIVNALLCALWAGARCEFLPRFDADAVWRAWKQGEVTLFMGVPTMYARLIAAWVSTRAEERRALSAACARLRLMVSGSAALPVSVLKKWEEITGHVLLERYGMTEIGMALSNPLHGERVPGHVGRPLPTVELRRVDEDGALVEDDVPGEIEVRGPAVFAEYWRRPEETRSAFHDGWFRTGDVAVVEEGHYRLLGRQSVDILKTGGYKVSALEIEEVLRTHPAVAECAVVGVPDNEWGEAVAACIVPRGDTPLTLEELRAWARERLAPYKIPRRLKVVADLPRNALGKVQKPAVAALWESPHQP